MKQPNLNLYHRFYWFLALIIPLNGFCANNEYNSAETIDYQSFQTLSGDTLKKSRTNTIEEFQEGDQMERQRQEADRIRDPALKRVPVERLLQARKIRDLLFSRPIADAVNAGAPVSISAIQWNERGPTNIGGRTRALIFDLNDKANGYKKVFAGAVGGGLWFTNDITATTVVWNKINDFFDNIAISAIVQNPSNPLEIYVGTGEGWFNGDAIKGLGAWKSSDGGATWTHLTNTTTFSYINAMLIDKNGDVFLATNDYGIEKSIDGGNTWAQVLTLPNPANNAVDLQLASNGDIYASFGRFSRGSIFVSDFTVNGSSTGDSGTWTEITPDPSGALAPGTDSWFRIKLACAPTDPNRVYAVLQNSPTVNFSSFQVYNKVTNTWSIKSHPGLSQPWYSLALSVDPNHADTVYTGSLLASRSTDGGNTWPAYNPFEAHADQHAYVYAPGSSSRMIIGSDGGVAYSENADTVTPTSIDKNNGYNVTQFYSVALHPTDLNYALAGSQDNGTQKFSTSGLNSTSAVTGGDGGFTFIDQVNGNIQISSYIDNNYYLSTDNGKTFSSRFGDPNGDFINPTDYDSRTKNLYSGNTFGSYFRWNNVISTNSLDTASVKMPEFNNNYVSAVTVAPITPNRVYFGLSDGRIIVKDNANGNTSSPNFILTPTPITAAVSCIAVDPTTEDHILVSYFNYGVISLYETKNATSSTPVWTAVEGNLPDMPVRWCMFYPGNSTKAIIATELGVWTTDLLSDNNTNWLPSNSGLANVRVDMLKFRITDRTLVAATHGRGLFTTTLPDYGLAAITGADSVCVGSSVKLNDPVAGGAWSTDNPAVATVDASGTVTGILEGKVNIFYAVNGQFSSRSETVNALPSATITTTGNTTIYQGESLKLTAGGGSKYKWSTGDTTATITVYKSGSYTLTAFNLNGCSSLSSPAIVTVNPALPATNFKLAITSASCKGTADGSINITASQSLNYAATVSGLNSNKTYSFTDSVKITSLPAGTYSVCITIAADQSDYNQCFSAVVSEPKDLSVYATTNPGNGLDLYLDGGTQYNIQLNGVNYTTKNNTITLPLKEGNNNLTVVTDRLCQGTFEKLINVSGKITPYPVPFQNVLYLNLGDENINDVSVEINDVNRGKLVYKNQLVNQSGVLALDVSKLDNGVYVVHLLLNRVEKIYKVIKK